MLEVIIIMLLSFIIGYLVGNNSNIVIHRKKSIESEEDKKTKEEYEKVKKAFNELMEYDYDKALGGGNNE